MSTEQGFSKYPLRNKGVSKWPPGVPKILSGDRLGVSQKLHRLENHNRLSVKAVMEIQLFSTEPDIKEICKNVKQCQPSH